MSGAADPEALTRDVMATLMPGFRGHTAPGWILDALADGLLSVCVYGSNVRDREQLAHLGRELREAAPTALIAIDEEGGEVTRLSYLEGSPYPGAAVLGRIDDEAYTEEIGRRVAHEILAAGFNLALAPDADVNSNPLNPVIGTRSFAATPDRAATHVAAWVRGLEGAGAIACPKHFPGHGDTAQDSHLALPTVDASRELLGARDLPPFRAAFAAGARTVMTSHILLPRIDGSGPATFSREILSGMLRDELGFTGVIVSDALDMRGASGEIGIPEAAVRALGAGCDLLCVGVDTTPEEFHEIVSHVVSAVADGRLDASRVADAAARVRALSEGFAPAPLPAVTPEPRAAVTAEEIVTIAASFGGLDAVPEWVRSHPDAAVVRIDTEANMAVGFAPWGPFAAVAHPFPGGEIEAAAFVARGIVGIGAGDDPAETLPLAELAETGVIVAGRDIHQHGYARAAVDALRAAGVPLLVVELGWPEAGADRGGTDYADLTTFGSSALVGAALIHLLESTPS